MRRKGKKTYGQCVTHLTMYKHPYMIFILFYYHPYDNLSLVIVLLFFVIKAYCVVYYFLFFYFGTVN